ncbi:MAG TPA: calcium/proton exchanger [Gemmatimonadales bacterium]|nr:calcium/proton exchanger [Gemmatimonadales bacterium]
MSAHTLTDSARRALDGARAAALRLGHDAVGAEHLVLGLLDDARIAEAFTAAGVPTGAARERLEAGGRRGKPRASSAGSGGDIPYTSHAKRLIELATREARRQNSGLSAEHLAVAALEEPRGTLARLLSDNGIAQPKALEIVRRQLTPNAPAREPSGPGADRAIRIPPSRPAAPAAHAAQRRRRFSWRLLLLLAVPVSVVLAWLHQSPVLVFALSCLGVLPLAGYMGEATEQLSAKTGPTIGGLLNATFGNAAELIIAIVALRAGLVELVKASITGSILGNLLLILGLSLVAGGLHRSEVRFNRTAAGMSSAMLALAVVGLVFPALFHALHPESAARASELYLSEWVAGILILTYGFSLLFSLRTHKRLFGGDPHPLEGPSWSVGRAVVVLGVATVGVAVESEILVHATEAVTQSLGLSQVFLGLIIIPLIGNAAEHAAAIMVARKGQMDLALQIALGSSTQIALLVGPLLVFAGLLLGQDMNLVFRPFEVLAIGLATGVAAILTLDGESHWFEGVQLLAVYAMVAVAAFFI